MSFVANTAFVPPGQALHCWRPQFNIMRGSGSVKAASRYSIPSSDLPTLVNHVHDQHSSGACFLRKICFQRLALAATHGSPPYRHKTQNPPWSFGKAERLLGAFRILRSLPGTLRNVPKNPISLLEPDNSGNLSEPRSTGVHRILSKPSLKPIHWSFSDHQPLYMKPQNLPEPSIQPHLPNPANPALSAPDLPGTLQPNGVAPDRRT